MESVVLVPPRREVGQVQSGQLCSGGRGSERQAAAPADSELRRRARSRCNAGGVVHRAVSEHLQDAAHLVLQQGGGLVADGLEQCSPLAADSGEGGIYLQGLPLIWWWWLQARSLPRVDIVLGRWSPACPSASWDGHGTTPGGWPLPVL